MADTVQELLQRASAEVAFVLEIEGCDTAFCSVSDTAGLSAAGWSSHTLKAFLDLPGALTREIDLIGHAIRPTSLQLELLDTDRSLAALFADNDTTAAITALAADLDRDDTTVTVKSTSAFAASGEIHIGPERITYSGKDPTHFTGCTRGTFPAVPSESAWGHTFKLGLDGLGPVVSSKPRVWRNRAVTVYLTTWDPDLGAWKDRSLAEVYFAGYLLDKRRSGADGRWLLDCLSVEKKIESVLLRDQFKATVREGFDLESDESVRVTEFRAFGDVYKELEFTVPANHYTIDGLIAYLNEQFRAAEDAGTLNWDWSFALDSSLNEPRTKLTVNVDATGDARTAFIFTFHNVRISNLLGGFFGDLQRTSTVNGAESYTFLSDDRPVKTEWSPSGKAITVENATGTWVTQASDDIPNMGGSDRGFIQIGEEELVWKVSLNLGTFTRYARYRFDGRPYQSTGFGGGKVTIYVGDEGRIPVKQVWISGGQGITVARHILRMLLSTGTADYNGGASGYDKWPASMGLGIPDALVDVNSFLAIADKVGAAASQFLVMVEPEPASRFLDSYMASLGFHVVWRNGKLTAIFATTPSGLDAEWTLDSSNTGSDVYTDTEDGSAQIITSCTLKYNYNAMTGDFEATETFVNLTAQSEIDEARGMEYEARSLRDSDGTQLAAWRTNVASPIMAYFGRAIRRHRRSGSRNLIGLSVGDVVLLNDEDAPDQSVGTYGFSSVKAWVVETTFDPSAMEFTSITLLVPSGRAFQSPPSAMLDYSRGDKGYDSAGPHLYLRSYEFSLSSEGKDVQTFNIGDKVRIVEVDPAVPNSYLSWARTITGKDEASDRLTIDSALAGFDTTKRYYVEYDDYATAAAGANGAAQKSRAYIGDDADLLIVNTGAVHDWGTHSAPGSGLTPVGTELFRRRHDTEDVDGEPLSPHKLRDLGYAANNAFAHVANQHPISAQYQTERQGVRSIDTYYLLAGPILVYCPPGVTELVISLFGRAFQAGNAVTFRATSTPAPPAGDSNNHVDDFGTDLEQVESSAITSTTTTRIDLANLPLAMGPDRRCYVTIEGKQANNGISDFDVAYLRGVSGYFAARPLT